MQILSSFLPRVNCQFLVSSYLLKLIVFYGLIQCSSLCRHIYPAFRNSFSNTSSSIRYSIVQLLYAYGTAVKEDSNTLSFAWKDNSLSIVLLPHPKQQNCLRKRRVQGFVLKHKHLWLIKYLFIRNIYVGEEITSLPNGHPFLNTVSHRTQGTAFLAVASILLPGNQ